MRILVACEESQAVTIELRRLGHEAYSCDIQPCSGGHPEWHIRGDALEIIKLKWDMIIAHPPCTYLTVTGNRWFNVERYGEKAAKRIEERDKAVEFLWHLQTRIARALRSRTQSATCQQLTKDPLKSYTLTCLGIRSEKQLAYG